MSYNKLQGFQALEVYKSDNANVPFAEEVVTGEASSTVANKLKIQTQVDSGTTTSTVANKLVDSGPYGGVAADDFTPTFTGAADVITCNIANSSSTNLNIVTTVVLGGSPTALTVTAL